MNKANPFDDLDSLRFDPAAIRSTKPKRERRQPNKKAEFPHQFYKRPLLWARTLAKARGQQQVSDATYAVADCLLYEAWRTNSNKVKLTNVLLARWHVGRKRGKRTAIDQLRKLRLISAHEQPHKSPVITVRFMA